jgi:WD40 repeat protein
MRIGEIGGEEVLIVTDDSGHATVHFTRDTFNRDPLLFRLPLSAWGIDTHSSKRQLAISCNAHIIRVYHLGMGIDGWDWTTAPPAAGETVPSIVLTGHTHNIPCVSFDKTGNYIASGSIDRTIAIWDCKTGSQLREIPTDDSYESHRYMAPKLLILGGVGSGVYDL